MSVEPAPELDFRNRAIVVTGAGCGLGRAYALELARRGAAVVVNDVGCDIDGSGAAPGAAEAVAAEILAAGGLAVPSYESVASPAGGEAIIQTAIRAFGRLDALICNAAILSNAPFHELSSEQIESVIGTNLMGSIYVAQPAFREMRTRGYGRIVFTSSGAGLFGARHGANYAAAKAGLIGLSSTLGIEGAAFGIRCNVIAPAAVTRMARGISPADLGPDASRLGAPDLARTPWSIEDVVALTVYLASEQCTESQSIYSAVGGRYARAFLGVGTGWYPPREGGISSEQVAGAMDIINDISDFDIPCSVYDELAIARAR